MKKAILFFCTVLILLFISFGCSESDDATVLNDAGVQKTETSFNFTLASLKKQEVTSSAVGVQASFTADQIMTGQLTATPSGGGTAQVFDWSIYFDEDLFTVQSNKTIILAPGTYDFALLLTKGDQQYAGYVVAQAIDDGQFDVPMTIQPIIGNTVSDVSLVESLADFKFQYDPAELSAASLTNPQLGIVVDGGTEQVFAINSSTGLSDNYINLDEGSYSIQLKLYDASLQVGRSITAQESVVVTAGLNITMDLVALHGETTFVLTEAGGDATFSFNIPAEVVDEVGGIANLEVLFSMVGDNNPLEQNLLNVASDGSGDYESSITLTNKQFDNITASLSFSDISQSPKELLGTCSIVSTLNSTEKMLSCDVILRRRAIVGGSLLATLGINVYNEAGEPVAGAIVSRNDEIIGITGNGTYATEGYLKANIISGSQQIKAEKESFASAIEVSIIPLEINNFDLILLLTIDTKAPSNVTMTVNGGEILTYSPDLSIELSATDTFGVSAYYLSESPTTPLPESVSWISTNIETFFMDSVDFTLSNGSGYKIIYAWFKDEAGNISSSESHQIDYQPYTNNGDGTVSDSSTGLMWQQTSTGTSKYDYIYPYAAIYCSNLNYANYSDWRQPHRSELYTLLKQSGSPRIDTIYFHVPVNTWKTWADQATGNVAWVVDFMTGQTFTTGVLNYAVFRCVRN